MSQQVGSNILVTEPTVGGTHKSVMKLLIGSGNEGLLFVTTSQTGRETIDLFEDCGGRYTKNRMAVVDASEEGRESVPLNIRTVSRPSNLTGINILYSSLYEQLQSSGIARVRTGFYDLSSLLTYNGDVRTIFRFLHTLTGRIKTSEGLGIFVIDPETQSEQTLRSLMQPFDGRGDTQVSDETADRHPGRRRRHRGVRTHDQGVR
ncbi:hypothetical protein BRC65_03735 [Halobacteriales archaeon QH_2_65_14]|nr:MAG: hypothetical protein BRC65_03735 [Halobacteriales archaeon QH_2_65_14]